MTAAGAGSYPGGELELFEHATTWKRYFAAQLSPFIHGRVLEVGSGLGATTRSLCSGTEEAWICLEPDGELVRRMTERQLPGICRGVEGDLASLAEGERFDAVLYVDVLEHIEDDRGELERAAVRLRQNGHLVVLAPAHGWLYSPFDAAIGHCRRYSRKSLAALAPSGLVLRRTRYLDSVGLLASLGNRLLLRRSMPTRAQLRLWDRAMVPLSRLLDPLLGYRLGKSVYAIWQRP